MLRYQMLIRLTSINSSTFEVCHVLNLYRGRTLRPMYFFINLFLLLHAGGCVRPSRIRLLRGKFADRAPRPT